MSASHSPRDASSPRPRGSQPFRAPRSPFRRAAKDAASCVSRSYVEPWSLLEVATKRGRRRQPTLSPFLISVKAGGFGGQATYDVRSPRRERDGARGSDRRAGGGGLLRLPPVGADLRGAAPGGDRAHLQSLLALPRRSAPTGGRR